MSFAYKCTFVVDDAKVPSTQTNFPVLVSVTDNTLKTVGNGGQVQSSSGYDIRFFSNSGLSSAIPFELEYYNASTGQIIFWVKIASLTGSGGGDTTFYAGYGDSGLTTNASSTSTWDSNYQGVYHLKESAGNTTVNDSTANAYTGTAGSNTSGLSGTGQIGSGFISNQTDAVTNSDTTVFHYTDPISISFWFKTTDDSQGGQVLAAYYDFATNGCDIKFSANQAVYGSVYFNGAQIINYASPNNSAFQNIWYHVTVTYDGSASGSGAYIYLNGSATQGTGNLLSGTSFGSNLRILAQPGLGSFYGTVDEVRYSNTVRTANWITTEYNNQSAPTVGNFYTSITFASNGGTAYSLSVLSGTFIVTGTNATLRAARNLPVGSGSYAETGTAATLRCARKIAPASGSYSISGTNAGLAVGRKVGCGFGSYSETGTSVGLKAGRKVGCGAGSYTITGTDATLTYGTHTKVLAVDPGSFIISGSSVTLIYAPIVDTSENATDQHLDNYYRRYANDRDTLSVIENTVTEAAPVGEMSDDSHFETYLRRYTNDNV